MGKIINILGTEYTVKESGKNGASNNKVVEDAPILKSISNAVDRYKLIRVFLYESGLIGEEQNEELVNWFAIQFPKLERVFEELDIEE
jgi:hypothetical protein